MPRVYHVKKARKKNPVAEVGESYYHWSFRFGGKRYSKTYPKRSQLTQSNFLSQLWDLEDGLSDRFAGMTSQDDIETELETLKDEIQNLCDECQESFDNMPEGLQYNSSSGELLQERIEGLDGWINDLDYIDTDVEEDLTEVELEERCQEIIDEIESTSSGL